MLTRLELTHFKNFKSATLRLGPFNLLIGANASGKSNLREAFRFLHALGRGYMLPEILGGKWGDGGEQIWSGLRSGRREIVFHGEDHFRLNVQAEDWTYATTVYLGGNGVVPTIMDDTNAGLSPLPDFASMRFFDFSPDSLRIPSMPGQAMLGDRGENLSSVLQHITADPVKKRVLLHWLQALTPMDVADIEFECDAAGKILLVLVEKNGMRVTALSASDGTLRFLAMLAAFLGPKPPRLCFIEELETGIHPTRQYLLVDFLEKIAGEGKTQIIATTHSPQLLTFLSEKNRLHASLLYRHENQPDARIIPVMDLPGAARVFTNNTLGELHAGGWFEDTASCVGGEHEP